MKKLRKWPWLIVWFLFGFILKRFDVRQNQKEYYKRIPVKIAGKVTGMGYDVFFKGKYTHSVRRGRKVVLKTIKDLEKGKW